MPWHLRQHSSARSKCPYCWHEEVHTRDQSRSRPLWHGRRAGGHTQATTKVNCDRHLLIASDLLQTVFLTLRDEDDQPGAEACSAPRHDGRTATLAAGDALKGKPRCQPSVAGQLKWRTRRQLTHLLPALLGVVPWPAQAGSEVTSASHFSAFACRPPCSRAPNWPVLTCPHQPEQLIKAGCHQAQLQQSSHAPGKLSFCGPPAALL